MSTIKDLTKEVIFNRHSWAALGAISPSKDFCLKAMDEYGKDLAIGLAKFVSEEQYSLSHGTWKRRWKDSDAGITDEELIERYLKSTT